ncbi:hypothetical protein FAES_4064 [Fibrella aestuarina BUZ 2]|uniref:ParB-like N-terminal domain-containing protein n=1 Tax=Fibrella aestuarina BUZ 2 TaxID=1166018 RepID=I0KD61_9BACT|nr:ParB N-terminal domain-containing protein [Fibrella aestuarina]CCH02064.1 hypothetical protein FAES_4064 [Fibrella aestuarina BUZ 2]
MHKHNEVPAPAAIRIGTLDELRRDERNANRGTALGDELLEKSIDELGIGRGVVAAADGTLIGGNHVTEKLRQKGVERVVFVPTDGKTLVVTQRMDIQPGTKAFHELALADNQVAQVNLNFDVDVVGQLEADFDLNLDDWGMDFDSPAQQLMALEKVRIDSLRPHPQNYKEHPADQIEHLIQSVRQFGLFRNVVISADNYILVGHGLTVAVGQMGIGFIPVVRLTINHDTPLALKLLVADNEIDHLGVVDDRKLSEILKKVHDDDTLTGTGYDAQMLANLVMVTRSKDEIKDFNQALEWVGLPEFTPVDKPEFRLIVHFDSEQDRAAFEQQYGVPILKKETKTWSTTYPFVGRDDLKNVRFEKENLLHGNPDDLPIAA